MTGAVSAQPLLVRVTADDIRRLQEHDPMVALPPAPELPVEKPAALPVANSIILHDGKNWTIVPNGALICLPKEHETKANAKPVGNLMPWEEFLAANSSWLEPGEISFEQAAGCEKLPVERIRQLRKSGKVIVATHRGGPISIDLGK